MDSVEVIEISKEAIFVLLKIATPVMLVALTVGLLISLFQALTQIQEMTLSFVPKIIAIFVSLIVFMPYILTTLQDFAIKLNERMANM